MSLTVFYTQNKVQMISIAAIGEIYDGSFREAVRFDLWKRNRFWTFAVLGMIPLTAMAVAFLDLWLNIFSLEIVELAESVMSVASIWFAVLGGLYVVSDPYLLRKIIAFSGRPYINKFEAEPEHR